MPTLISIGQPEGARSGNARLPADVMRLHCEWYYFTVTTRELTALPLKWCREASRKYIYIHFIGCRALISTGKEFNFTTDHVSEITIAAEGEATWHWQNATTLFTFLYDKKPYDYRHLRVNKHHCSQKWSWYRSARDNYDNRKFHLIVISQSSKCIVKDEIPSETSLSNFAELMKWDYRLAEIDLINGQRRFITRHQP